MSPFFFVVGDVGVAHFGPIFPALLHKAETRLHLPSGLGRLLLQGHHAHLCRGSTIEGMTTWETSYISGYRSHLCAAWKFDTECPISWMLIDAYH